MKRISAIGCGLKGRLYLSFLRSLICLPVFFLWGKAISGRKNILSKGPFLVVVNHQSFLDFLFVTLALKKFSYISGFIKVRYYDLPFFLFFLKDMDQIRADNGCIASALKVLKAGHPLVLFPEGTRTRNGKIGNIYPGIELILRNLPETPVLPMGIRGAFDVWPWNSKFPKLFLGRKVSLRIGRPLFFTDFCGKESDFAKKVMHHVACLSGEEC